MTKIRVLINGGISEEIDIDKPFGKIDFRDVWRIVQIQNKGRIIGWVGIEPDAEQQLINNIERNMKKELKELIKRRMRE